MGRHARTLVYLAALAAIAGACASGAAEPGRETSTTPPEQSAPAPSRVVALTGDGDVVVIDLETRSREATLASFRARTIEESSSVYGRADDLTALPDGGVLVSTCCEPAGGAVVLLAGGKQRDIFSGWDPQVDPSGAEIAIAGIPGIAIHPASLAPRPTRMLVGDASVLEEPAEDPAWSPDGRTLVFTTGGRLAVVDGTAGMLGEALFVDPEEGTQWSSPAYTRDGVVAVLDSGSDGASRLVAVDPATGETTELVSSSGPITDVAVDPSGRHLLWVDEEGLSWQSDGERSTFEGDFVAAAWLPAQS